jgi:hypothetical protein
MTTELAGQTALIIGAGRGTGRAPARRELGHRPARDGCPPGGGGVGSVPVAASSHRGWDGVLAAPGLDPDSARWLQALANDGPRRESALAEPRRIRAFVAGETVLDTIRALYVWEWPYYPSFEARSPAAVSVVVHDSAGVDS